jgi:hypothetical protein
MMVDALIDHGRQNGAAITNLQTLRARLASSRE